MDVVDPRETTEDLLATESRQSLEPAEFEAAAASEAATVGWVVLALAFDDAGRVLLIEQPWADGWLAPGGVLQPGESLARAVTREVREETGVEITPIAPRTVDELTFENERTGETDGWTTVFFEAHAEGTAIDRDPSVDDEEVTDADWFDGLPGNVYNPDLTESVYERCRGSQ